ncbi:membrane protein [Aureimonas endophytica]|uniref:Membrane protein n=1 Tax=Aureimonas endophytica TaxID=2027858 RepID=A0A916ZHH8_9HYPH|nr:LrgB family protein [Aureimonas endophytica]GGD98387.1 membrane protein [Aureimonas endophytica]
MTGPSGFAELWVYLAASPLLWLTLTIGVFLVARRAAQALGNPPLANPVLLSIVALVALLRLTDTPYPVYFSGAQFVHFALGPATVALGVPLYRNRRLILRSLAPVGAALLVGSLTGVVSVVGLALLFGLPEAITRALAPKSVTAGIAMGIAAQLGADPALAAVFVMLTGIVGAVIVTPLMNALRIRDYAARGFAAGLASHGLGTARAFQVDGLAGTFAGLAMALNGLVTSLLAPVLLRLLL